MNGNMTNQAYTIRLANVGHDVVIWEGAKIISSEVVSIGDSVIIDDFVFIMGGEQTIIGSFIHIASFTSVTGGGKFIMEDFATLSSGVRIFTGSDDFSGGSLVNSAVPYPYRIPKRTFVQVKKHAIIGANSIVLPSTVIGEGAAIGANSLITKDCEPWTLYYGSPARPIRPRPKEKILALETKLRQEIYEGDRYIPSYERRD
jgi:galactoside O-acetyltransferase